MGTSTNVSLSTLRKFLRKIGCQYVGTKGGHEKWHKEGLTRPIIIQTHIDPIPPFILSNTLRNLGISKKEFLEAIKD